MLLAGLLGASALGLCEPGAAQSGASGRASETSIGGFRIEALESFSTRGKSITLRISAPSGEAKIIRAKVIGLATPGKRIASRLKVVFDSLKARAPGSTALVGVDGGIYRLSADGLLVRVDLETLRETAIARFPTQSYGLRALRAPRSLKLLVRKGALTASWRRSRRGAFDAAGVVSIQAEIAQVDARERALQARGSYDIRPAAAPAKGKAETFSLAVSRERGVELNVSDVSSDDGGAGSSSSAGAEGGTRGEGQESSTPNGPAAPTALPLPTAGGDRTQEPTASPAPEPSPAPDVPPTLDFGGITELRPTDTPAIPTRTPTRTLTPTPTNTMPACPSPTGENKLAYPHQVNPYANYAPGYPARANREAGVVAVLPIPLMGADVEIGFDVHRCDAARLKGKSLSYRTYVHTGGGEPTYTYLDAVCGRTLTCRDVQDGNGSWFSRCTEVCELDGGRRFTRAGLYTLPLFSGERAREIVIGNLAVREKERYGVVEFAAVHANPALPSAEDLITPFGRLPLSTCVPVLGSRGSGQALVYMYTESSRATVDERVMRAVLAVNEAGQRANFRTTPPFSEYIGDTAVFVDLVLHKDSEWEREDGFFTAKVLARLKDISTCAGLAGTQAIWRLDTNKMPNRTEGYARRFSDVAVVRTGVPAERTETDLHEVGHALCGLHDEYEYDPPARDPDDRNCRIPAAPDDPNVLVWDGYGAEVKVGCTGPHAWRPSDTSIMNSRPRTPQYNVIGYGYCEAALLQAGNERTYQRSVAEIMSERDLAPEDREVRIHAAGGARRGTAKGIRSSLADNTYFEEGMRSPRVIKPPPRPE